MDWLDIKNGQNVNVITETVYRGVLCKHVENKGWKIVLGCEEYLFPHYTAARKAIDDFHAECVSRHGAIKQK